MPAPRIRKTQIIEETVFAEMGQRSRQPLRRAAGIAVFENPFAGRFEPDLTALFPFGELLGELLLPDLIRALGKTPVSYGKAAIIGADGDAEHAAALLHPRLGAPIRAAIGGGKNVIPSTSRVGPAGTCIDVPLAHKDDPWSFAHIDTFTLSVPDAPRPGEAVLIIALADGPRINARIG